jgi:hypothetical protein
VRGTAGQESRSSDLFRFDVLVDRHVFEFAGFKDIAAFLALNKFSVFLAGYNPHARMPADFFHKLLFGELTRDG